MLVVADKGLRIGNLIIDKVIFMLFLMLQALVLDGLLHVIPKDGSPFLGLYFLILYWGYHFLFEYFFSKTPGKFITHTVVVNINGDRPSVKSLAIRNICRFIPFDLFSFLFGEGWHDSFSQTQVVLNKI